MTLPPRVVLVHRRTELEDLLARHGTRGAAAFFLSTRGRSLEPIEARHASLQGAIETVSAAIPVDWRRGRVERADLPRFLFAPEDVVVVVGPDGLVANVAKYLDGQVVVGIDPDPGRNPGVLVPHAPTDARALLPAATGTGAHRRVDALSMVAVEVDDGQRLVALNELYVGSASHQTARYTLTSADGRTERQASSGVLISTGTGATGWCRSAWLERQSPLPLPAPADPRLAWFVREAWPSPATGTASTQGLLEAGQALRLTVESDRLVTFGDGIEDDALTLTWGQTATYSLSPTHLSLLR